MNDLLGSVKGAAQVEEGVGIGRRRMEAVDERDVELGGVGGEAESADAPARAAQPESLAQFFATVSTLKASLAQVKRSLRALQQAQQASKSVTKAEEMREVREQMQAEVEGVGKLAHSIKEKLEQLEADNEKSRAKAGRGEGSSEDRTRTSITNSLKKRLKETMGHFQQLRADFQQEYREVVERRVFTLTGEAPREEQVEQLMESGAAESLFQSAILQQGRTQVLDTLAEIQERHEAVRELEQGLLDLHQIFVDMAVLVEQQGELLDNIEANVAKASEYVQQGNQALEKAKVYQRRARKWMCCGVILLLVILCAILVPVLKPWASGGA